MSTTPPTRSQLEEIAASAFAHQAHSSTFRLIDKTDLSRGGTAIAVNVGSRFFLATARHVIPKGHQFAVVLRDLVVEEVSGFAARHIHPDFDVGLLELADKDVGLFGDNFVSPERFLLKLDEEEESPVTVIGYPRELTSDAHTHRISEDDYLILFICSAFTFHSVALPRKEWPKSGTGTVPVPGRDIFIDFDPESTMRFLHPAGAGEKPRIVDQERPHPAGISGGGIWVMKKATDTTVWQPRALLCGIQFGYHSKDGWLRGAPLNVWLETVEDNYPDLQSEVQRVRALNAAARTAG